MARPERDGCEEATGAKVERAGRHLTVHLNGLAPERLNQALVEQAVPVRELVLERRRLEDAYLGLTGTSGDARR